jgi:hypothetical protein
VPTLCEPAAAIGPLDGALAAAGLDFVFWLFFVVFGFAGTAVCSTTMGGNGVVLVSAD